MKNKISRMLVGSSVLAGLLMQTFSMNLCAQEYRLTLEQSELSKLSPQAIDEEIARIEKAVKKLKRLKVIVPILLAGVGVAATVTALGISVASVLLLRIRKQVKLNLTGLSGMNVEHFEKWWGKLGLKNTSEELEKSYKTVVVILGTSQALDIDKSAAMEHFKKMLFDFIRSKETPRLALGIGGIFGGGGVALATAFGTVVGSIVAFVGLKKLEVTKALEGAYILERIDRYKPGTLTEKQKTVITQLKKLSKERVVKNYMKGLRMKEVMTLVINKILKRFPGLFMLFGSEKKTRKILAKYIGLRWRAGNLQELLEQEQEHRTLMKRLTTDWSEAYKEARSKLVKIKRKTRKLENKNSVLKHVSKDAIPEYKTRIESTLKEFEEPVKPKQKPGLPVIAL